MFNHVGHLTLVPEAGDAQIEAILSGLLALPDQVDGLVEAHVVRDAGLADGNATLRFHMRFVSQEAWQGYKTHPAHVSVISTHIGPVLGSKAFVQYDDADVRSAGV
ncbi:Dabb family protein [Nocardioides alcanivorans]|uniref:Dabb family protein n=1 Tax=Nocardioides alcanivorans TaxID=2897352 RepID=UPI001F16ED08|nr:Dabb family protein [Nocardioides alcanivorans]